MQVPEEQACFQHRTGPLCCDPCARKYTKSSGITAPSWWAHDSSAYQARTESCLSTRSTRRDSLASVCQAFLSITNFEAPGADKLTATAEAIAESTRHRRAQMRNVCWSSLCPLPAGFCQRMNGLSKQYRGYAYAMIACD